MNDTSVINQTIDTTVKLTPLHTHFKRSTKNSLALYYADSSKYVLSLLTPVDIYCKTRLFLLLKKKKNLMATIQSRPNVCNKSLYIHTFIDKKVKKRVNGLEGLTS